MQLFPLLFPPPGLSQLLSQLSKQMLIHHSWLLTLEYLVPRNPFSLPIPRTLKVQFAGASPKRLGGPHPENFCIPRAGWGSRIWISDSSGGKESACNCRRPGFDPWVRKMPWSRGWLPTPVFLPGKSHGQMSLVGCSLWVHKVGHNWATNTHTHTQTLQSSWCCQSTKVQWKAVICLSLMLVGWSLAKMFFLFLSERTKASAEVSVFPSFLLCSLLCPRFLGWCLTSRCVLRGGLDKQPHLPVKY